MMFAVRSAREGRGAREDTAGRMRLREMGAGPATTISMSNTLSLGRTWPPYGCQNCTMISPVSVFNTP